MDTMIEVLRAFEYKIWEAHRNQMPNEWLRQCVSSFVVRYEFGDDDNIGSIFLMATKASLSIKVFRGKDPDCAANIIFAPPEIYDTQKAARILERMVTMIDYSAYEGYYTDVELMAQDIEKEYNA